MFLQFNKQKQSKIYITRNANNSQVAYNRFEKYKLKFVNVAKRLKFAYEQFKWIDFWRTLYGVKIWNIIIIGNITRKIGKSF